MNQRFEGSVDQVAAGDIHNHVTPFGRLLTKAERVELNDLVKILDEEYGYPGWGTWQYLHKTIGFEGIDAMCIGHRDAAIELLHLQIRCEHLQRSLPEVPEQGFELAQKGNELAELTEKLKKTKLDLSRLIKRYTAEKKRADDAEVSLSNITAELKNNRLMLSRAHDQISQLKADVMRFRKRSNRLGATVGLVVIVIAAGLTAIAILDKSPLWSDADEVKAVSEMHVSGKKGARR